MFKQRKPFKAKVENRFVHKNGTDYLIRVSRGGSYYNATVDKGGVCILYTGAKKLLVGDKMRAKLIDKVLAAINDFNNPV